jgi:hypothetical protein
MEVPREWAQMDAQQLQDLTATLFERMQSQETQLTEQLKIDQLTHEIATLNRWRYAKRSEQLDERIARDICNQAT